MFLHTAAKDFKPAKWAVNPVDLPPKHRLLWRDCSLALPFWSINESQVADVGPNRLHGVLGAGINPASDWVGSPYGAAIHWTGQSTDKVTIADPPNNALDGFSEFSFEVLFRTTSIGSAGTQIGVCGKYRPATGARAWRLYIDGDELALQTSNDGAGNEIQLTTNANLAANTWYQAVVTFKSGVWTCRVNGVLCTTDGNFSTHTTVFGGTEEFKLGQRTTAGSGADTTLTGDIGSFRLWQRVLLDEETLLLWTEKWGMYDGGLGLPSLALLHSGSAAAGPWVDAGVVPKTVQELLIQGLINGVSYDVRLLPRDTSGNQNAGNTPAAATPAAAAKRSPAVRTPTVVVSPGKLGRFR